MSPSAESEFLSLVSREEAWERLVDALGPVAAFHEPEVVPVRDALGRTLLESLQAPENLPAFRRSTVDGFAVIAVDTFGASASLPAYFRVVGEVPMGRESGVNIGEGQAAIVHTGGMLPEAADAVVMMEDTESSGKNEIEVMKSVAESENVLTEGEDLKAGETALEGGRMIRPQEMGGLMALGIADVTVARRPLVGLIATGDEVVPANSHLRPGQVRDVNSGTLAGLVVQAGGTASLYGIIPDDFEALQGVAQQAHRACDIVVISAGSSVSERDMTVDVIGELGKPGVLVHGISIRPGKPTILAVCDGKVVIGLPGNPVSALVVAGLFLSPLIHLMLGRTNDDLEPQVCATLAVNVASKTGREDHFPVRLERTKDGWTAYPVYGRSNLIYTLVRADGLMRIPSEANGVSQGERVDVHLF